MPEYLAEMRPMETIKTKHSFDKDVFREDKGDLLKSYREVVTRLKIEASNV